MKQEKILDLLKKLNIPSVETSMIGDHYIHIYTKSFDNTNKWIMALGAFCSDVKHTKTIRHNKVNKNTSLLPTKYECYHIMGII